MSCPCMTSWIQFSRSQTADELRVMLCWQQMMENVRLVSVLFKQCFTLFDASVGQRRDVECATGFIVQIISEDNLKHTALDIFSGFRLFFAKAGMLCWTGIFQDQSDYSLIVIDKVFARNTS